MQKNNVGRNLSYYEAIHLNNKWIVIIRKRKGKSQGISVDSLKISHASFKAFRPVDQENVVEVKWRDILCEKYWDRKLVRRRAKETKHN